MVKVDSKAVYAGLMALSQMSGGDQIPGITEAAQLLENMDYAIGLTQKEMKYIQHAIALEQVYTQGILDGVSPEKMSELLSQTAMSGVPAQSE